MKPYLLDNQLAKIKRLYYDEKLSATTIGKQFGCSHTAILDLLERHGLKRREKFAFSQVYEIDETFFDKIDTSEKAYWLGFLYADGYNHCDGKRYITLKLQARDKCMLVLFKKALKSDHPIKDVLDNGRLQAYFRICNKRLSANLERLGAGQAKSLTLKFPTSDQVPGHLIRHFVRGYFDGDGCITMSNGRPTHCQINFCLTKEFGESLNLLLARLDIKGSLFKQPPNQIHHLAFGGRQKVLRFMSWMYEDSNGLFLDRKHQRYELILAYIPKKGGRKVSSHRDVVLQHCAKEPIQPSP